MTLILKVLKFGQKKKLILFNIKELSRVSNIDKSTLLYILLVYSLYTLYIQSILNIINYIYIKVIILSNV